MTPRLVKTRESNGAAAAGPLLRPPGEEAEQVLEDTFLQPLGGAGEVREAAREVDCLLITEGPGNKRQRNFYTPAFVTSAVGAYEGKKAYLNHMTEEERRTRGEGNIRELCGYYKGLHEVDVFIPDLNRQGKAVKGTLVLDESDAGDEAWAKARAQMKYRETFPNGDGEYCGLSINGTGLNEGTQEFEGSLWKKITAVGEGDSVDVVTRPARGGAFKAIMESVQGTPAKSKENGMKKILILVAEAADLAERLGKATVESDRVALQKQISDVHVRLKEAEMDEKPAEEMGLGDEKPSEEMGDELGMIRKLIPKMTDESDDDYSARIGKVKEMCAPGKEAEPTDDKDKGGMESLRETVSVDSFRTHYPKLFNAVASRVKESVSTQNKDFGALKIQLHEAQVKNQVYEDQRLATTLLSESSLPKRVLDVGDLIGQTREEMIRTIDRHKAIMESAGARLPVFMGGGQGGGGNGDDGAPAHETALKESVQKFIKKQAASV